MSDFSLNSDGLQKPGQEMEHCEVAADLLENERYLTGAERAFLERVVACENFDRGRLQEIAGNHGRRV